MIKAKPTLKLIDFDATRYLVDEPAIAEYLSAIDEIGDPELLALALSDVNSARSQNKSRRQVPVHSLTVQGR